MFCNQSFWTYLIFATKIFFLATKFFKLVTLWWQDFLKFESCVNFSDYDEDEGEVHEQKQQDDTQQSSSAEVKNITEKLKKVMEEGEVKGSDVEDGEISDEGEEGEILSDDQVSNNPKA